MKSQKTGSFYIGNTKDIERRIRQHNGNHTRSTRNKGPYFIVYKEEFSTKHEAATREKEIKSYKGNRVFKRLVNNMAPSSSPA
ncbi:MAG: GIY-YIG nuclease family protein [Candidatus Omnitrophica bacterium]|nr:GIY-YIG nuclease family protein [Candidatus Omnitrophota bacterium]